MEDNEYSSAPPAPKAWTVTKTVVKTVFFAFIVFIYGFFILRFCTSEPSQDILWTDKTIEAYENDKENFKVYTQRPQVFIAEHDEEAQTGFNLSIFHITYIPSAKQLQVTVRYNKNILQKLEEKYGEEIEDEPFVYSLRFNDNTQITGYSYRASKTNRYYFRYLVFDGVDLETYEKVLYTAENSAVVDEDGNIIAHETNVDGSSILYPIEDDGYAKVYDVDYIYLDAYYINNVNRSEEPDASLMVFNRALELDKISYSKYYDGKVDDNLFPTPYYIDKTPQAEE